VTAVLFDSPNIRNLTRFMRIVRNGCFIGEAAVGVVSPPRLK
jgi:hypothetical protein